MPVTNHAANLTTGIPYGPGKLSVPDASPSGMTMKYELGSATADRTWNGDGLYLSAEARTRADAHGDADMEHVRVRAGMEGLHAKIGLVKNGEVKPRFEGLSLKDGAFKGEVNDARDYLKAHPVAGVAAVTGAVALAHVVAKETGDPIKVDTGKVKLYSEGGFTASVVGEVAITGKKDILRAQGGKLRLGYNDRSIGDVSLEAGYDRDDRTRVSANWSRTLDNGMNLNANAFYEEKTKSAGVFFGMSYKW
jgi:hypothetical protein